MIWLVFLRTKSRSVHGVLGHHSLNSVVCFLSRELGGFTKWVGFFENLITVAYTKEETSTKPWDLLPLEVWFEDVCFFSTLLNVENLALGSKLPVFKVSVPFVEAAAAAAAQRQLHPREFVPLFCSRHVNLQGALQPGSKKRPFPCISLDRPILVGRVMLSDTRNKWKILLGDDLLEDQCREKGDKLKLFSPLKILNFLFLFIQNST